MLRAVISAWSALALTGTSAAEEITIVTRSHNGHSYAEIIQTGRDDKPVIETRRGPGYVIIEQRNKHNRALIIQGGARGDE